MPTELSAEVVPSELSQIVASVFETMLSLQVNDSETPWFPSPDRLTSAVQLMGEWNGAVLLECDRGQSCRFAARFLSIDLPGDGGRCRARRAGRTGQHDRRQPEMHVSAWYPAFHALGNGWQLRLSAGMRSGDPRAAGFSV